MNKKALALIAGVVVVIVLVLAISNYSKSPDVQDATPIPGESVSDGQISMGYLPKVFGLATTTDKLPVTSYIPPCDENFTSCFYYLGNSYEGTNFESAGLRVAKRPDLTGVNVCLDTPPQGYDSDFVPAHKIEDVRYSTAVFPRLGNAGAGHFAEGYLYRLYIADSTMCYEFETRVGQTNFLNYPKGEIDEFTTEDSTQVAQELDRLLRSVSFVDGSAINFPRI